MSKLVRTLALSTLSICLSAFPAAAWAAQGGCSQPVTNGSNPTASDCLFILKVAVGSQTCGDKPCICDTGGAVGVTASDALLCLQKSVNPSNVVLTCHCAVTTTSTSTSSTTSSSTTTTVIVTTTTMPAAKFEGSGSAGENAPAAAPGPITASADETFSASSERLVVAVCSLPQS